MGLSIVSILAFSICDAGCRFFQRYPALHAFLRTQLAEAATQLEGDSAGGGEGEGQAGGPKRRAGLPRVHPALYPVLILLSRLRPGPPLEVREGRTACFHRRCAPCLCATVVLCSYTGCCSHLALSTPCHDQLHSQESPAILPELCVPLVRRCCYKPIFTTPFTQPL